MGQIKSPEESDFSLLLCSPGPISRTVVAVEQPYLGIFVYLSSCFNFQEMPVLFTLFLQYDPSKSSYSVLLAPSQCGLGAGS